MDKRGGGSFIRFPSIEVPYIVNLGYIVVLVVNTPILPGRDRLYGSNITQFKSSILVMTLFVESRVCYDTSHKNALPRVISQINGGQSNTEHKSGTVKTSTE